MDSQKLTEDHINAYLQFLRNEERAPATIEKYLRDVRAFARWCHDRPLSKNLTAEWKLDLLAAGFLPATVNAKLSALNHLLKFLGREDCRVKFLKVQRKPFQDADRELDRREYNRLLQAAQRHGPQTALLLETICATGIRVSELQYITVEALRLGRAEVRLKGKIRTILLPEKLRGKLLQFAQKEKIGSGAVFRAETGKPFSRFQVWRRMKALCKGARVAPSKVFPHNLRHLFAVTFYQATRDIAKLADLLGHSAIDTTRIYLRTAGREHARLLDRLGLVR